MKSFRTVLEPFRTVLKPLRTSLFVLIYRETPFDDTNAMSYNLDIKQGPVDVQFFKGGTTNICYNAIDRHVEAGKGDKVAFYWEGNEPGIDSRYVRTLPF